MSRNHKEQLQGAKADFVKKLTAWINQTTENLDKQSDSRLVEAGLMQRILDVHVCREKTTQNVYLPDVNRYFMPHIQEVVFNRLRQINTRDVYLRNLFESLWSKNDFIKVKAETKALVECWVDYPRYRQKFPYSLLKPDAHSDSRPKVEPERPKVEPERPKEEPKKHIPDAWDDEDDHVKQTPAEEFTALAKEFGVPFRTGDNIVAAYKRIALLVHPDKHPSEETDTWAAKMKRLNALREALE